jgi:hypothetical protein
VRPFGHTRFTQPSPTGSCRCGLYARRSLPCVLPASGSISPECERLAEHRINPPPELVLQFGHVLRHPDVEYVFPELPRPEAPGILPLPARIRVISLRRNRRCICRWISAESYELQKSESGTLGQKMRDKLRLSHASDPLQFVARNASGDIFHLAKERRPSRRT